MSGAGTPLETSDHSATLERPTALDRLPLHLAVELREVQRRDDAKIATASPRLKLLLPIALSLARIAAADDLLHA